MARTKGAWFAAAALCAYPTAQAQPRRVHVETTDALGQRLDLSRSRAERLVVVVFTGSDARASTEALSVRLDRELRQGPLVETWMVADVTSYDNFITRGIVRSRLREEMIEGRRRRAASPNARPGDRWHLIGDLDGAILRRFGIEEVDEQVIAFLVDGTGRPWGPFVGVESLPRLLAAIERARSTVASPAHADPP